ncbi:hypothetical protein [Streptomyces sp. NBC_00572]|uniref:hypothetical protein n=1 Tax=Streptomyces sp. NBC_00572 TaxID=2903664 RepID=UPI00224EE698|nr:hypothetical protein [Streptomyces sp. NBC_00572]MCX4981906.1 hypothetical protein [Streptomyces sp. NBC_00572]
MATRTTAETTASMTASAGAERRDGRFSGFVRVSIALQTVSIFFQAVTAGMAVSSSEVGSTVHDLGSKGMYAMSMLYLLAAILAWRPGGGSARPILYATGFLVLGTLQVVMGVNHVMEVHLPLGVLMFGLSLLDLGRVALQRMRPARG